MAGLRNKIRNSTAADHGITKENFLDPMPKQPETTKSPGLKEALAEPKPPAVTETAVETVVPDKEVVKQRSIDKKAISKFESTINKKEPTATKPQAFLSELNSAEKQLKEQDLADSPEIKQRLDQLKSLAEAANKQFKSDKDTQAWAQVAETLGHAFTKLGAGAYGLKHGIDMSGIKFDKTNWAGQADNLLKELNNKLTRVDTERRELQGMQEKGKQARQDRLKQLTSIADKKRQEKGRAQELGLRQQEAKLNRISKEEMDRLKSLKTEGKDEAKDVKFLAKSEDDLRREWNNEKVTKDTKQMASAYKKIQDVGESEPTAAGDISMIFSYMRMLDPASTVREGEFATAKNASTIPDRVRNIYNRTIERELLDPKTRKEFVGRARQLYDAQLEVQGAVDDKIKDIAAKRGLDLSNILDTRLKAIGSSKKESKFSEQDKQALEWANANPEDPRAEQIKARLGQ